MKAYAKIKRSWSAPSLVELPDCALLAVSNDVDDEACAMEMVGLMSSFRLEYKTPFYWDW